MIAKLQIFILMVFVWLQGANQPLIKSYASYPAEQFGLRVLDVVMAFALLVFNVGVVDSLKSTNSKSSHLTRLIYPIVLTSYVICLSPSKEELSMALLVITFFIAIDWFDGFKDIYASLVEKLHDYGRNRGLPIPNQDASMGLFLLVPIDCVLIYLAAQRFVN